jgi:hypothetical protein
MKQNVINFDYSLASIVSLPARGSRFVVAMAAAAENQSEKASLRSAALPCFLRCLRATKKGKT